MTTIEEEEEGTVPLAERFKWDVEETSADILDQYLWASKGLTRDLIAPLGHADALRLREAVVAGCGVLMMASEKENLEEAKAVGLQQLVKKINVDMKNYVGTNLKEEEYWEPADIWWYSNQVAYAHAKKPIRLGGQHLTPARIARLKKDRNTAQGTMKMVKDPVKGWHSDFLAWGIKMASELPRLVFKNLVWIEMLIEDTLDPKYVKITMAMIIYARDRSPVVQEEFYFSKSDGEITTLVPRSVRPKEGIVDGAYY